MGVMRKLNRALSRARGPVACPKCGEKQRLSSGAKVITCTHCGYRASFMEWSMRSAREKEDATADPDVPPADTKIKRRTLGPGAVAWEIPPSGKSGGMLGFAVLWTGFTAVWTTLALLGSAKSEDGWIGPLFSLPFWAVGLTMLYFSLRGKYAWHLLMVKDDTIVMARSFFKRTTRKSLGRSSLKSVEKKEFYQQNYTPVYGIEIRGKEGKLRFGTTLREEEKDWLVADMRRVLWPGEPGAKEAVAASGGTRGTRAPGRRAASFQVDFPPTRANGTVVGTLMGALVVGGFLAIGIFALKDAGFFRWLWLGLNSFFALLICLGALSSWRNRNRILRVRGDRSGVHVETLRGRTPLKKTTLAGDGPVEVRSFSSGSLNNSPRVRIELLGQDQVIPVAKWYPEEEAREPLRLLREALGMPRE